MALFSDSSNLHVHHGLLSDGRQDGLLSDGHQAMPVDRPTDHSLEAINFFSKPEYYSLYSSLGDYFFQSSKKGNVQIKKPNEPTNIQSSSKQDLELVLTESVYLKDRASVKLDQGFSFFNYTGVATGVTVPAIIASVNKDLLFGTFLQMVSKLGPVVDVVLASLHHREDGHDDFYREKIDLQVLLSILYQYEEVLMNDGYTGIVVIDPNRPQEVQFDEHKLLIIYGSPLEQAEFILASQGLKEHKKIKCIVDYEHTHRSPNGAYDKFLELKAALGFDSYS